MPTPNVLDLNPRTLTPHTVEALLKTHEVVCGVRRSAVELDGWFYQSGHCGTVACAVGWSAQMPWFNERGLVLSVVNPKPSYTPPGAGGKTLESWPAVVAFYQLAPGEAEALFLADFDDADQELLAPGEPAEHKARVLWRIRTLLVRFNALDEAAIDRLRHAELESEQRDDELEHDEEGHDIQLLDGEDSDE